MTTSMAGSSYKDTELEELFPPSYEEIPQPAPENVLHAVPEEDATPDKVRDYLVQLLVAKRILSTDHAQCIADRRTIGTGKELRSYPPDMYFEVFGREDGWIVFREVKICICQEQGGPTKASSVCVGIGAFAFLEAFGYGLHWSLQASDREGYTMGFGIAIAFCAMACIGCFIEALGARPPEVKDLLQKVEESLLEGRIERELHESTRNDPRARRHM